MISQLQDPGAIPGQDHQAHMQTHQTYQQHPLYTQLLQMAQQRDMRGMPVNGPAAQQVRRIDELFQQHMQQHQQLVQQQEERQFSGRRKPAPQAEANTLMDQVQSNAQKVSNVAAGMAREEQGSPA